MRFLSVDIETTGLKDNDVILEFAAVPYDPKAGKYFRKEAFHVYFKYPKRLLDDLMDDYVKKMHKALFL